MRDEYKVLCSDKTEKEKIWNDKMKGFYHNISTSKKKLDDIQAKDEEEEILREKIKR